MKCPACQHELPTLQGHCPHCGAILTVHRESFGKRHPALLISVTLLSFITLLVAVGYAGYHFLHKRTLTPSPHGGSEAPDSSDEKGPPEFAV